jgi:hypothetical protein
MSFITGPFTRKKTKGGNKAEKAKLIWKQTCLEENL